MSPVPEQGEAWPSWRSLRFASGGKPPGTGSGQREPGHVRLTGVLGPAPALAFGQRAIRVYGMLEAGQEGGSCVRGGDPSIMARVGSVRADPAPEGHFPIGEG